ncbi:MULTISPECIES: hypothetical protein [Amycolatopsis]|uniref:Uncharacterized protein n=1 Tax=Amycolatopsis azurea DSM 43854 TaxID=1238180 RepID=M2PMU5_9PSEU|nr:MULTISPECIES: hypothetical protein [Amycolatopsis]EMD25843.1 hypothetical protein C791_4081 [Amycolatopsis azurea DSM 43854]
MNPIFSVLLSPLPDELLPPAQPASASDAAAATANTRPKRTPDTDYLP